MQLHCTNFSHLTENQTLLHKCIKLLFSKSIELKALPACKRKVMSRWIVIWVVDEARVWLRLKCKVMSRLIISIQQIVRLWHIIP